MGAIGSCLVSCLLTLKMHKERNLKLPVQTDGPHFYGFCNPLGVKIKCVSNSLLPLSVTRTFTPQHPFTVPVGNIRVNYQ